MSEKTINSRTPLSIGVMGIIAGLSPYESAMLLEWLKVGGVAPLELASVMARLINEPGGEEFVAFYRAKNKFLAEELEREDDVLGLGLVVDSIDQQLTKPEAEFDEDIRVAYLLAQLPPDKRAMLLSAARGGMTPELAGLIGFMQEELNWAPLIRYYQEKNKFLIEEIERQAESGSRPGW